MHIEQDILGVDISKSSFDVYLIHKGKEKHKKFTNDETGFKQLSSFLDKQSVGSAHCCMESTGRYFENLALFLAAAGHLVSVVNPVRVKGFAVSELNRSKTDKLDAGIIARFCRAHSPAQWTPPPQEVRFLQEAERYLDALKTNLSQELNRLESGLVSPFVKSTIEQHVKELKTKILEVEHWMSRHIETNRRLNDQYKLITSVIGVGDMVAFTYLAEMGYSDNFDTAREVESYSGLTPRRKQSGSSVHGKERLSKIGNAHLRKVLYMPAMSAIQHNPAIRSFADRLKQAGKPGKVIICAVMRKLLRVIFAVVKSGKPFDLNHQSGQAAILTT